MNSINNSCARAHSKSGNMQDTVRCFPTCFPLILSLFLTCLIVISENKIHITRTQKICRELEFQNRYFQLESVNELEALLAFRVLQILPGCSFEALTVDMPPFFLKSEKFGISGGIDVKFMDLISDALQFKYKYPKEYLKSAGNLPYITLPSFHRVTYNLIDFDTVAARLLSGTSTKDDMAAFARFDLVVPFYHEEEKLRPMIDISAPFTFTTFSSLIRTPPPPFSAENSIKSYFLPFTPLVWVSVLAVSISTAVAWTFVRRFNPVKKGTRNVPDIICFLKGMFDVVSILPTQGDYFDFDSFHLREDTPIGFRGQIFKLKIQFAGSLTLKTVIDTRCIRTCVWDCF